MKTLGFTQFAKIAIMAALAFTMTTTTIDAAVMPAAHARPALHQQNGDNPPPQIPGCDAYMCNLFGIQCC